MNLDHRARFRGRGVENRKSEASQEDECADQEARKQDLAVCIEISLVLLV